VLDSQWLQQLHTYGLLEGAFRPPEEIVALRVYMRQRETILQSSDDIRHMQKSLRQMNLLLDNVVSDVNGATGMKIIRAILSGERDPTVLAKIRDKRCKEDEKTIAASLEGHYCEEHLFVLKQAVDLYWFAHVWFFLFGLNRSQFCQKLVLISTINHPVSDSFQHISRLDGLDQWLGLSSSSFTEPMTNLTQ